MGGNDQMQTVVDLLCGMIAIDSRSSVSNVPMANFMEQQLGGWEIERIDYVDGDGIAKTNIIAADPESASPWSSPGISIRFRPPAGTPTRSARRSRETG